MATYKIGSSKCHHIRVHTAVVQRLKCETAKIGFLPAQFYGTAPLFLGMISEAAMATETEYKGRSGHINLRRCGNVVHTIHWSARKL